MILETFSLVKSYKIVMLQNIIFNITLVLLNSIILHGILNLMNISKNFLSKKDPRKNTSLKNI